MTSTGATRCVVYALLTLAALVLSAIAATAPAQEPPASVSVEVGAGVSVSDDSAAVPVARLTVDAPVWLGYEPVARLRALLQLHGSPDATVFDPRDVRTFQGAEVDLELARRVGASPDATSHTYVVLKVGGATRRDAAGEGPAQRFPMWYAAGLAVEHRDEDGAVDRRLTVTYGTDQLSSPDAWAPRHLVVVGQVRLLDVAGASFSLGGELHRPTWGTGRSVFRLFSVVGWGR